MAEILVVNCGSSSVKLDVLAHETGKRTAVAKASRVGTKDCSFQIGNTAEVPKPGASHEELLRDMLPALCSGINLSGIGHRVVHGGDEFTEPTRLSSEVVGKLEKLTHLAPLHNPANLAGISACLELFPNLDNVAVFDTAFHATLPRRAKHYALPKDLVERHGIRRYGFHGPSHSWVASQAAGHLSQKLNELRVITCHLGNGASCAAIEYGRSVETSMGMTPLEGLVMGTRSGDVDPGVLLTISEKENLDTKALDALLNKQSGLAGLSGVGNDMRDIIEKAGAGNEDCRLALQVFTHRLRKYIGSYAAVMGGVDAIVFTGGIGENSALIRHRALQRFEFLGALLDEDKNRTVAVDGTTPCVEISKSHSRVKLLVVATDEARAIARETAAVVGKNDDIATDQKIPIAVSARHIHLTPDAVSALFGEGYSLTPYKPLSQPGQFACNEKLTIVGPRKSIENVRVLGPTRGRCQVEISRSDEFTLGVDAPVRNSGDVANSPGVTLVGPKGTLTIENGLICARRHIHMTPADADRFGVADRDIVSVAIDSGGRDLIFGDVLIRVSPKYALEMHVDTDEANAAELSTGDAGVLEGTGADAQILKRTVQTK